MAESCLKIKPLMNPYQLLATCAACGKEVMRQEYNGYSDYKRKESKYKSLIQSCPYCKASYHAAQERKAPKWAKKGKDYVADCENGNFLVFKWGHLWRWRYLPYGATSVRCEDTGYAYSIEVAKRACEKRKEWK